MRTQCRIVLLLILAWGATGSKLRACSIFVLVDAERTLFCNNEDWFERATRIWFVPAGADHLACAYVGFDNGWAQGGVNSAGLAFDWVSGYEDSYRPEPDLHPVRGNPSQRMLETCTTVGEAVAFYRTHLEPDFRRSRILIADRTGASVAIGSRDGRLHVVPLHQNRGFGYGQAQLDKLLPGVAIATVEAGAEILRTCLQAGDGGTKYSTIYDLRSLDIFVFPEPTQNEVIRLNLAEELAKGAHTYALDRPRGPQPAKPQALPLPPALQRFYLDQFLPIADALPDTTRRLRDILAAASSGDLNPADYSPTLFATLFPVRQEIAADLVRLGAIRSLTLVEDQVADGKISRRYLVDFDRARVLGHYVLDRQGRLESIQTEFVERKSLE